MSRSSLLVRLVVPLLSLVAHVQEAEAAARAIPHAAEVSGVVNLNTATDSELRTLPGIGPSKAQKIIAQRTSRKFATIDEIMKVKGIGRKTYRKLKPHLAVTGPTTIKKQPRIKAGEAQAAGAEAKDAEESGQAKEG